MTAAPTEVPAITTPTPFTISFSDADLEQFHRKLDDARLPDGPMFPASKSKDVEPKAFPTLELIKGALQYWRNMDMKAFEAELNTYPHFTTSIDWCKQLHFIHQPSSRPDAIPLIFCHGWPGSFLEAAHIAKPLAEPEDPSAQAFHVVIPSLPGYTFSSGPPTKEHETGDVDGYCRLLDALMRGLGYDRYAAQGGDWGSVHARVLASRFAKNDGSGCRAVHLNFLPTVPGGKYGGGLLMALPESVSQKLADWTMSEEERKAVRKALLYNNYGSAYYKIQRERPSQIGFGLIDSPVAILGYMANFTNGLGINIGAQSKLDIDWLLHETFLYWVTKSAATSFLPYALNKPFVLYMLDSTYRVDVPFGYTGFPNEIIDCPLNWARNASRSNTSRFTWYAKSPTGGHLASTEKPHIFIAHMRAAFAPKGEDSVSSNKDVYGKQGDEDKLFVQGASWKSGGLWDEERKKDKKTGAAHL
ncbi:alpha/beta-hydrolase [Jaminaea rosea]|uniref:Alpha/beta-hydrolase n=1 Tax=Jaminaea rosea TaxID=1569628 RepID=A0A316UU19_9BASI|nr:alpha/beta-hydrolase [Jaminaea rosea]PWN27821.1 alpha/beta-hydrolase [Jaminaea rosea]